jgi:RHS repeat-associated protein
MVVGLLAPISANAAPLGGADGQTLPREQLLTPQELGAGSVNGLQYGNPTEGLVLMSPPGPANDGTAQLTYPMSIPPGRGITPSLQLTYNSSGGDTWVGTGWDLSLGSVGVDTRRGAPRFDPNFETESYTLNGNALVPNGLDGTTPRINADRQDFTEQVDTKYDEITRVYAAPGAGQPRQGPANYYWRVRDKAGDVFWYGGYPDAGGPNALDRTAGPNGIDRSAIVSDGQGNQVQWLLSAQRDVGVNLIKYHYRTLHYSNSGSGWVRVDSCATNSTTLCAQHTYLSGIEYTAAAEATTMPEDAPYHVQFLLESDVNPQATVRSDATLTAVGGYLDLTSDRLAQVNVYYQPPVAGSTGRVYDPTSPDTFTEPAGGAATAHLAARYDLAYRTGAFGKSQLASVTQVGNDGTTSATHTFDYYHDVGTTDPTTGAITSYQGFGTEKSWSPGSEGLNTNTINANAGVLGANETNSGEGHFYIGFNPDVPEKEGSFGGALKLGGGDTNDTNEWLDLNGDGLPDEVWINSSGIHYRLNTGGAGSSDTPTFSDQGDVTTLTKLGAEHNFNFNAAIEAFFGVTAAFGIGATYNWADQYFADVNGDGLPDFVDNGQVWFNHLDANGVPTFTQDSSATPVPIDQGAAATNNDPNLAQIRTQLAAQSPLVDTVRRWVAPYNGTVTLNAPVTLSPPTGTTSKDGVRVAIQQNGTELFHQTLLNTNDTAFSTPITVNVQAGDRLYFRVGSIDDGAGDQVTWSPVVNYTKIDGQSVSSPSLDENMLDRTTYSSTSDFTTAGRPGAWDNMPNAGSVKFVATVHKSAVTSDDLRLVLTHNGATVPGSDITIPRDFVGDWPFDVPAFDVQAPVSTTDPSTNKVTTTTDRVAAYLGVDSPIDLTKITWRPQLQYVTASRTDANGQQVPVPTTDASGNPTMVMDLLPEVEQYPSRASTALQQTWAATGTGPFNAVVHLTHGANTPAGTAIVTVKDSAGHLVAKDSFAVPAGGSSVDAVVPLNVSLTSGTSYWFDVTLRDPNITNAGSLSATLALRPTNATDNKSDISVPSLLSWEGQSGVFPLPYRGWGVAGYNGDGDKATAAIDESAFTIDTNNLPKPGSTSAPSGYDDPNFSSPAVSNRSFAYVPVVKATPLAANPVPNNPTGIDAPVWQGTRANLAASADTVRSSRLGSDSIDLGTAGGTAHAVDRTSISGPQFAATAGFGPASLGFSIAPTFGLQDFIDMNGDGLPDIVTAGHVQYTKPRGQYESSARSIDNLSHTSQDLGIEVDPGVSAGLISIGPGKSDAHATSSNGGHDASGKPGAGVGSIGLAASIAWNDPTSSGSSAGDPTQTYADQINQVKQSKEGGGLPAGAQSIADVNGDGLPDLVSSKPDGVYVRYNLGYGFAPAEVKIGDGGFSSSNAYGGSLGGGFMLPDGSFSGGVSANWNYQASAYEWKDVNGDGILDRIHNPGDGSQPTVAFGTGTGLLPDVAFGTFESGSVVSNTIATGPESTFTSSNGIGGSLDFTIGIPCFAFCNIIIGVGGSYQNTSTAPQVDVQDVNGDGFADSVKSTADGTLLVRANQTGRTNLLAKVTNPIGGTIALDYTRAGNTTDQPSSVWTMSSVTVDDGHPGDGPVQRKTFSYAGGKYDRLQRQNLGFHTVAQNEVDASACAATDPSTCGTVLRTTTTTYFNDNVFDAGQVTDSLVTAGTAKLSEVANTWRFVDVRNGGTADLTPPANDPANVRALGMSVAPTMTRTETFTYGAGNVVGQHSMMDFQYDSLGNVVKQVDYGQLDNPDDDVVATYTYSTCDTAQTTGAGSLTAQFGCGQSNPPAAGDVKNPPAHPSPLYSPNECATYVSVPITFDVTNGKADAAKVTYRHRDGRTAVCDDSSVTKLDEQAGDGTVATTLLNYDQWGNYNRIVYPADKSGRSYAVEYFYDGATGEAQIGKVNEYELSQADAQTFINDSGTSPPNPPNSVRFAPSLGLSASATFDGLSGRVATRTDPNNFVTSYAYDAFGRIASVSSPRSSSDPPLTTFSYDLSSPGNAMAVAHNYDLFHPSDPIDTVVFTDGTGRVTQNKRDAALFAGTGQPATVGAAVSGHVDYDALGRAVSQYNPIAGSGPFASFDTTAPSGPVTTSQYDGYDRVIKQTEPGNRVTTDVYDFAQVGGTGPVLARTTEVDPANHTYVTYNDVRDVEIAAVDKPATADPALTTVFKSDGMGQLTGVVDSAGNVTTNTYDEMGRRTSTQTPDSGLITFGYDAEGKLISQLTPNERAADPTKPTTYTYNFERLTRVDYPGTSTPSITYAYGGQGDPNFGAGRVIREEDGSRIQTLQYDPAGDITKQTAEMKLHNWPGPGSAAFQWTTSWSYDGFGRLAGMTYPDGETVNFGYDAGGQVNSIAGDKTWFTTVVVGTNPDGTPITVQQPTTNHYSYLSDRQYDVFLQRKEDVLGNGVTTTATYDPNTQWLTRVLTVSPQRAQADAAHQTIQDLNYTYDAAGNPKTYADTLPAPVSNLFGGPTTQQYTYDGYNRLTSASGVWQAATGKSQHYTYALGFDTQGNVVSKSQLNAVTVNGKDNPIAGTTYSFTRTYSAANPPHQAVSDSTGTYQYDNDGNLLGIIGPKAKPIRQLTWDLADETTAVNDSASITTYAYDDNGERRIERGPSGETAFINPWVTVLNGNVMYKHVWAGNDRLATQKTLATGEEPRYFLHKDLQGSTNMVTDQLGNTFQHQEYFPTGEVFVAENSTVFRTPYQYAGDYTDNTRDIVDIGARWYDPQRETFYAPDPALADSTAAVDQPSIRAAYAYAGSNAIANIDPTGNLWATVNKPYAADLAKSQEQILDLVKQNGPDAQALFKDVYNRSYQGIVWRRKANELAEKASPPFFEFRFTPEGDGVGVTVSYFGTRPRALNKTASLQIAAANLAAMAPANAQQGQHADPLTPEAQSFADAFAKSQAKSTNAANASTNLGSLFGFSQSDLDAAAANLAGTAPTLGERLGFSGSQLNAAQAGLAAITPTLGEQLGFSGTELNSAESGLAALGKTARRSSIAFSSQDLQLAADRLKDFG